MSRPAISEDCLRGRKSGEWMSDRWEGIVFARDPELFPELDDQLFGEPVKRMKIDKIPDQETATLIPADLKALKKELKLKAKSKSKK